MDLQDLLQKGNEDEGGKEGQSPLVSLKKDLEFYKDAIKEVSTELVTEGYTLFPIFVAHQLKVDLGELILDRHELGTSWTIHASSLEEFVDRGIIKEDRKAYFEKQYKSADDYMCLFVIVAEGANFVFYPYA